MNFNTKRIGIAALAAVMLSGGCGFHRKKYENPITKDTEQPDKVLFDKAIGDIEKGRYEVARLTLNTLINTYDSSEYLAKAKLAIADSWMRQSGAEGFAQAEAEFKDFQLFYPTMEEAPEAQSKICEIHIRQMEKADRDPSNALRAEQECRDLLTKYPNSKFAPATQQRLREIQEVLAQAEMVAGDYYYNKGALAAATNRFTGLVGQYPLYSRAAEALWLDGNAYSRLGTRFRDKAGEAYARLVREYPLSPYADQAKKKLQELELPVPEADPAAARNSGYRAGHCGIRGDRVHGRCDGGAGHRQLGAGYAARRTHPGAEAGGCSRRRCAAEAKITAHERDPAGGRQPARATHGPAYSGGRRPPGRVLCAAT
jgi:outer membrane protein assembly factor BamD